MFFKKRSSTPASRSRHTTPLNRGNSTVFSYHASRSVREGSAVRSANKQPWNRPSSTRRAATNWLKRAPVLAATIIVVALVINSLIVGKDPEIITLADKQQQKIFLRTPKTYQEAARSIFASSILNTNKLTIDTTRLAETMSKQFPELAHISVTLPLFGHRPAIYIQPALPALLVKTADSGVFILDANGRALINTAQTTRVERLGLPMIEDQSGLPIVLGKVALPSDDVAFIREVVGQLGAKGLRITNIVLPKGTSELDIRLEGMPYIVKFNLHGDARVEAGAFLAVKRHLERENKTPGKYVDVRVENRAYYQ